MIAELILAVVGFLILFVYAAAQGVNKIEVFYFVALSSHLTALGDLNISIILIFFSTILLLLSRATFSAKSFITYLVFGIIVIGITLLSTENSLRPFNALGRALKFILIFFPLFVSINISNKTILIFLKSFVFTSTLLLLPGALLMSYDAGYMGIIRVKSFFSDPNYFALLCLVLYSSTAQITKIKNQRFILLLLIAMTQSLTIIGITFIVLALPKILILPIRFVRFLPIIIPSFYILILYILNENFEISIIDFGDATFQDLKLNSVYFRIIAQNSALEKLLSDASTFWFGFGSGLSVDLFGRVLHNAYLQLFFDSGILLFLITCILMGVSVSSKADRNVPLVIIFFTSLLFDPIFMFIYTMCLFINNAHSATRLNQDFVHKI